MDRQFQQRDWLSARGLRPRWRVLPRDTTPFTLSGLTPGQTYTVAVRAWNAGGCSAAIVKTFLMPMEDVFGIKPSDDILTTLGQ